MTALEEYESKKGESLYAVTAMSVVWLADAAIESLKCCGNCRNWELAKWHEWDYPGDDEVTQWENVPGCGVEEEVVIRTRFHRCHFAPSRWKERTT